MDNVFSRLSTSNILLKQNALDTWKNSPCVLRLISALICTSLITELLQVSVRVVLLKDLKMEDLWSPKKELLTMGGVLSEEGNNVPSEWHWASTRNR